MLHTSRFTLIALSIFGGGLLYLAWPPLHFNFIAFAALLPLLYIEEKCRLEKRRGFMALALLMFLSWNIFTTWWIWYASAGGCILAILCNSLLMCLPVALYHSLRKKLPADKPRNVWVAYVGLISFWTGFEYFHLNWDGNWPWLNLGNCWSGMPDWVQWYEYTGALGGTIWIWAVNISLFELMKHYRQNQRLNINRSVAVCLLIGGPVIISYSIKSNLHYSERKDNAVAVQPDIDPYNEKFSGNIDEQISKLLALSNSAMDSNTSLLVWPETAIAQDIDERHLMLFSAIARVKAFLKLHPKVKLVTGINSFTEYPTEAEKTATARPVRDREAWYDIFNTAMLMDTGARFALYHKSRLVPGVEVIPFQSLVGKIFGSVAIQMGGPGGSLGTQKEPTVFKLDNTEVAAPVICYESIFGEYVSEYIKKGANIITIITNDGWWDNTDGYKQHLAYARLRAIENRKFIVRSANTGISCFILPSGEILMKTKWWLPAAIKHDIIEDDVLTFYTLHGDYLGRAAAILSGIFFIWLLFLRFVKKTR